MTISGTKATVLQEKTKCVKIKICESQLLTPLVSSCHLLRFARRWHYVAVKCRCFVIGDHWKWMKLFAAMLSAPSVHVTAESDSTDFSEWFHSCPLSSLFDDNYLINEKAAEKKNIHRNMRRKKIESLFPRGVHDVLRITIEAHTAAEFVVNDARSTASKKYHFFFKFRFSLSLSLVSFS